MENVKILWLDESEFCHDIDNFHDNSIGSCFEMELDNILSDKLNKLLGEDRVYTDSDFIYRRNGEEVVAMYLIFGVIKEGEYVLKTDKKDYYSEALTRVLKEVFETDDVLLITEGLEGFACWIIEGKERMLWLIDKLNDLGMSTENTFKVVTLN